MREDLIKRMQQGYKFGDSDVILEAVEEIDNMRQQLDGWIAANSPKGGLTTCASNSPTTSSAR